MPDIVFHTWPRFWKQSDMPSRLNSGLVSPPSGKPDVQVDQSSIEHRLVVGCSWLGAVFSAIGVVTNWHLGSDGLMVWGVALASLAFVLIVIAGRRGVSAKTLSMVFLLNVTILIAVTWEANGGVRGSTTPAIAAAVVFSVLAMPGRHAILAIAIPLAIFVLLCVVELWDGVPAKLPFLGMANALDSLITTLTTSTLCGVGVAMMRRVYDRNLEQLRLAKAQIEGLAARAVAADRDKSRFLARMSHDLRTPLAAVVGSLEVATRESLRPQVAELLTAARRRCVDLERIIGDLLDLGLVESGELTLRPEAVDLLELVDSVVADTRPAVGVALRVRVEDDVPRWILSDATRVRQTLGNLLGNACKHTDQGQIELHVSAVDELLRFCVTDTGPGIVEADRERLFQPFSQLPRGKERGGTGLGLFIARQIATMLGGTVTLAPATSAGTQAVLDLPLVPAAKSPESAVMQTLPRVQQRSLRILLADDEAVLRLVVEAMLESLGCEVVTVENGAAAVDAALSDRFDVVLLDVRMPVMDGLDAARRIRAARPDQYIVALTANVYAEDVQQALDAGMNAFLAKPVTLERLQSALDCRLVGVLDAT